MNDKIPKQIRQINISAPHHEVVTDIEAKTITLTGEAARRAVSGVLREAKPSNAVRAPGGVRGLSIVDYDSKNGVTEGNHSHHTRHSVGPDGEDRVTVHVAA